ncbi:MAG TPA: hypothetical protein EYQ74_08440 [Planctomycetes bacterium]|nr:hypothetical protein [Planctomycetota bacterium]HIK60099.1 hypothetical protein [Planctomycetota bacterium]
MNDDKGGREWGDISELKKKSQLPKVACCFLGCVMPLIVLAVIAGMGYQKVSSSTDRELQWAQLEGVLPFAERPDDLTLVFGLQLDLFDFEFYLLLDSDPGAPDLTDVDRVQDDARAWILMRLPAEEGSFLAVSEPWEAADSEEPLSHLEVQGQSLGVGFLEDPNSSPIPPGGYLGGRGGDGPTVVVELPSPDPDAMLVLLVSGVNIDELTAAEVIAFLDHFQIGSAPGSD